jgi:hypothetical protein
LTAKAALFIFRHLHEILMKGYDASFRAPLSATKDGPFSPAFQEAGASGRNG